MLEPTNVLVIGHVVSEAPFTSVLKIGAVKLLLAVFAINKKSVGAAVLIATVV